MTEEWRTATHDRRAPSKECSMTHITDAQVEVAFDTYWGVVALEGDENRKAMRAALEAYERVRDVQSIYAGYPTAEQRAEDDAKLDQGLKNLHRKLQKDYPR